MLRFQSVMVSPDNADKDDANVTLRTCLSAFCAANTIIDDYKYVNAEIDYAKLSFTGTKDPKITVQSWRFAPEQADATGCFTL